MDEHGTRNVKAQLNGLGCTETDALGTAVKAWAKEPNRQPC